MESPLVSVIVPVYNGERFIGAALDSIFAQDYRPIDVVVLDDGSTDGTSEIVRSYLEVRCIYQPNQGPARARNACLSKARGELITFLDCDDLWHPHKLSRQVPVHLRQAPHGCSCTYAECFLEPGCSMPSWVRPEMTATNRPLWLPSALMVSRGVFDRIGVFDAYYCPNDDTEWLTRARDAGVQMAVVREVLLRRRIHGDNIMAQTTMKNLLNIMRESIARKRAG